MTIEFAAFNNFLNLQYHIHENFFLIILSFAKYRVIVYSQNDIAIIYLRVLYQHSLLNMDAYLISLNGNFNLFLSMSCCRQYDESLFCDAYLHDLGCVFSMIELNTHDWVAFPLRICIFSNTNTTTTRASYFRVSTILIFCYSMLFCKSN